MECDDDSTFDLIVSDLMMPGMSGAQLVAVLRERGLDVPAVFTSGYPHGMQMPGLDDTTALFVAKPFSGETLSAAVRHLLDRQAA
jgi:CheY-like chemotaxis protein